MMIESANFDVGVVSSIVKGRDALKTLHKDANVEDIAELKDDLDDMMAEHEERTNLWADFAKEDTEGLADELDALEMEMAEADLKKLDLKQGGKIVISDDEEEELSLEQRKVGRLVHSSLN